MEVDHVDSTADAVGPQLDNVLIDIDTSSAETTEEVKSTSQINQTKKAGPKSCGKDVEERALEKRPRSPTAKLDTQTVYDSRLAKRSKLSPNAARKKYLDLYKEELRSAHDVDAEDQKIEDANLCGVIVVDGIKSHRRRILDYL